MNKRRKKSLTVSFLTINPPSPPPPLCPKYITYQSENLYFKMDINFFLSFKMEVRTILISNDIRSKKNLDVATGM